MAWGWAVDRPADPGVEPRVPSGHVLSETAGAVEGFSTTPSGSIGWRASEKSGVRRRPAQTGKPEFSAAGLNADVL